MSKTVQVILLRASIAFVFFLGTIAFLFLSGSKGGYTIEKINFIFLLLFVLTFTAFSPEVAAFFADANQELSPEYRFVLLSCTSLMILIFNVPIFLCALVFATVWFIDFRNINKNRKYVLTGYFLILFFCIGGLIVNDILVNKVDIYKIYARYLLSSYLIIVCGFGLLYFKKKSFTSLGVILVLSTGQLIISLFDIVAILY